MATMWCDHCEDLSAVSIEEALWQQCAVLIVRIGLCCLACASRVSRKHLL